MGGSKDGEWETAEGNAEWREEKTREEKKRQKNRTMKKET